MARCCSVHIKIKKKGNGIGGFALGTLAVEGLCFIVNAHFCSASGCINHKTNYWIFLEDLEQLSNVYKYLFQRWLPVVDFHYMFWHLPFSNNPYKQWEAWLHMGWILMQMHDFFFWCALLLVESINNPLVLSQKILGNSEVCVRIYNLGMSTYFCVHSIFHMVSLMKL